MSQVDFDRRGGKAPVEKNQQAGQSRVDGDRDNCAVPEKPAVKPGGRAVPGAIPENASASGAAVFIHLPATSRPMRRAPAPRMASKTAITSP